jgi:predicted deacetylase
MATPQEKKYILISLHDVTPFYEKQTKILLKELDKRKIKKFSILVIPSMNDEFATLVAESDNKWNILKHKLFVKELLRYHKNGAELILHGLDHRDGRYIHAPLQFENRLRAALHIFKKAFALPPKGYIPPRWFTNKSIDRILKKYFDYTEDFTKITFFDKNIVYKGFPLGMESLSHNKHVKYDKITPLLTRYFSKAYATTSHKHVIRYTLHTREAHNGNFQATLTLLDNMLRKGYVPVTYSELNRILSKKRG